MVKCWPRNLGVVYLQGLHNYYKEEILQCTLTVLI